MKMTVIRRTPLDALITRKLGLSGDMLNRDLIESYQLKKLNETIQFVLKNSPFYKNKFSGIDNPGIKSFKDLERFPMTSADDIAKQALQFLCISQDEISRVVTLESSGTTGNPKRIYFTPLDQELTIDFFRHGMSTLVKKGDRVMILLPGERPGSVGDLLSAALKRFGVIPVPHGVVRDMNETLSVIRRHEINSLVGIPVQVFALARYSEFKGIDIHLKSVLLSTDNLPSLIVRELERLWGCRVFDHYGMTEMGLGGGVECDAHAGYHLREADMYFEIVDDSGKCPPDGKYGEVVFTTLTRSGMPLIRYKTGDISRFLTIQCECGTQLKLLDKIAGRRENLIKTRTDRSFSILDLDEIMFATPGVIDYTASVNDILNASKLSISALTINTSGEHASQNKAYDIRKIASIINEKLGTDLTIKIEESHCMGDLTIARGKRRIAVSR
ncbi:MAG TPA: AMP-binding protein [Dissulfurispiraceae bacterium]|nr:AMP-binding protein [Dissulfurispiraceae bacterium]